MSTREQILTTALRVLNADAGASLATVAEAAGVGRATLHRHFASRQELLHESCRRSLERYDTSRRARGAADAAAGSDPAAHRAALGDLVARYVADAADFSFVLTHPEMEADPDLAAQVHAIVARETAFLASAQRCGVLRDDVPAAWLNHVLFGLTIAANDARRYGDVAPSELAELTLRTYLDGVDHPAPTARTDSPS